MLEASLDSLPSIKTWYPEASSRIFSYPVKFKYWLYDSKRRKISKFPRIRRDHLWLHLPHTLTHRPGTCNEKAFQIHTEILKEWLENVLTQVYSLRYEVPSSHSRVWLSHSHLGKKPKTATASLDYLHVEFHIVTNFQSHPAFLLSNGLIVDHIFSPTAGVF